MKVEARIFEIVMFFAFLAAIIYGISTALWGQGGIEVVGLVGLILTGCLALLSGSYFRFIAGRIEARPEDRDDAEIADGAGEMGFFSPGSYWPFTLGLAVAFGGLALAFFQIWMIAIAVPLVLIAIGGLVFEYHRGSPVHKA